MRQLVELETIPAQRTLHSGNRQQQILALAHFDDGTTIDVTPLAVFSTRLDPAVSVSADGLAEFTHTGEATILVRYLQEVRSVRLRYVDRDPEYARPAVHRSAIASSRCCARFSIRKRISKARWARSNPLSPPTQVAISRGLACGC